MGNISSTKVHFGSVTVREAGNHDRRPVPRNRSRERQLISYGISHMSRILDNSDKSCSSHRRRGRPGSKAPQSLGQRPRVQGSCATTGSILHARQ